MFGEDSPGLFTRTLCTQSKWRVCSGLSSPGCASAPLRTAASERRKNRRKAGGGGARAGGPAGRPFPERRLLSARAAPRPPRGELPGPCAARAPLPLLRSGPAARWAGARPHGARRPGRGTGQGRETGRGRGGAAGTRARVGEKGGAELQELAPAVSRGSGAQLRGRGAPPQHSGLLSTLAFAAPLRAVRPPRALGARRRWRAPPQSRARGPSAGSRAGTHRRGKQVYSYSNKRTNCAGRGGGASNRRARGLGAALHKAIFCVGASGAFACCGVISGFEKRTAARPHFPLWFRRRRKCFAGG